MKDKQLTCEGKIDPNLFSELYYMQMMQKSTFIFQKLTLLSTLIFVSLYIFKKNKSHLISDTKCTWFAAHKLLKAVLLWQVVFI